VIGPALKKSATATDNTRAKRKQNSENNSQPIAGSTS